MTDDMAYSFHRSDRTVQKGMHRIATSQIDSALQALEYPRDLHEAVHDVRKSCKKLRGLMRLVRPVFPAYAESNATVRDTAALLSEFRNHSAALEILGHLSDRIGPAMDPDTVAPLREELERRRAEAEKTDDIADRLDTVRERLSDLGKQVPDWKLKADGFDAMQKGLRKTLHRARDAMTLAEESRSPQDLHDWRKRVKYHWYHARLLRHIWPRMMDPYIIAADELGQGLGDIHDLAVFRTVLQDPTLPGASRFALHRHLEDHARPDMENDAFALGARLFSERPKALAARWERWWDTWHAED